MWSTGAAQTIARLTSSTLFANHNVVSMLSLDARSASTTTTSNHADKASNVVTKMRGLRARSPYALFVKDHYAEISAKNPELKLVQVSKKMSEAWKTLADDKKQTYLKTSQDQRTHYEQEKQRLSPAELQSIDGDEKARRIQNRVKKSMDQLPTKRPRSAFIHFLSSMDRGEATLGEFMKGAAQRWAHMATQEKQKFEDLHLEEQQRYVKTLVAWAAANEKPEPQKAPIRVKKTTTTRAKSATGSRTVKKRTAASTTRKVASGKKADSDREASSSSDDDASSSKTKKRSKSSDTKKPTSA